MQINTYDVNLIMACLRLAALSYQEQEQRQRQLLQRTEADKSGAFARACADLADRFEKGG